MKTQFAQSPVVHTQFKVLPVSEYMALLEKAEMLDDVAAYDKAKAEQSELIPSNVVDALIDGENPVKVWRKYRGLSQGALAELAGLSQPYIAQIEAGNRTGTTAVYRSLATALQVDLDDLVD